MLLHGPHRVDVTPNRPLERDLFKEACATPQFARVTVAHQSTGVVYTQPAELRAMRDLYDTLASRMEALQRAEAYTTSST